MGPLMLPKLLARDIENEVTYTFFEWLFSTHSKVFTAYNLAVLKYNTLSCRFASICEYNYWINNLIFLNISS